jgi:hypothetical protein
LFGLPVYERRRLRSGLRDPDHSGVWCVWTPQA